MPSVGETARGLRDHPLGKVLILVAALGVALLVMRGCGSSSPDVPQERAIAIAREQIDYVPDRVQARVVNRGVPPRPSWAVSLSQQGANGALTRVTVVVLDGQTGEVVEVRRAS